MQNCCKSWRQIILNKNFWCIYGPQKLPVNLKYRFIKTLSYRRTKGHLVIAENRFTNELFKLKQINFEIMNANVNDGVPGRTMREISFLKKLDNPMINKIIEMQINEKCVIICQRYFSHT